MATPFYHGLLPVRQSHGHGASCLMGGHLTLGEEGFGETMGQCRVGPCCFSVLSSYWAIRTCVKIRTNKSDDREKENNRT